MSGELESDERLREVALVRLRKRREFRLHLTAYIAVNTLLVLVWAHTDHQVFWPIFPLLGWGIGLGVHAWDTYGRRPIGEDEVQREIERLRA